MKKDLWMLLVIVLMYTWGWVKGRNHGYENGAVDGAIVAIEDIDAKLRKDSLAQFSNKEQIIRNLENIKNE